MTIVSFCKIVMQRTPQTILTKPPSTASYRSYWALGEHVQDCLMSLNAYNSMRPDEIFLSEGGGRLEQAAPENCGCFIPRGVQGQIERVCLTRSSTWPGDWQVSPWQEGWNFMGYKVPSEPSCSVIVYIYT